MGRRTVADNVAANKNPSNRAWCVVCGRFVKNYKPGFAELCCRHLMCPKCGMTESLVDHYLMLRRSGKSECWFCKKASKNKELIEYVQDLVSKGKVVVGRVPEFDCWVRSSHCADPEDFARINRPGRPVV